MHAVGELFCSSQPIATTCLRWNTRVNPCSLTRQLYHAAIALTIALLGPWPGAPEKKTMLMSPIKGETSVHSFNCPGHMVVRMRKVLTLSWSFTGEKCLRMLFQK